MSSTDPHKQSRNAGPTWQTLLLFLAIVAIAWWLSPDSKPIATQVANREQEQTSAPVAPTASAPVTSDDSHEADQPTTVEFTPESDPEEPTHQSANKAAPKQPKPNTSAQPTAKTDRDSPSPYLIPDQQIRDLNGKVAFRGTVDLKPTLDRIKKGGSNRHRNDGTTFQNREGRLPKKPSGYFKEYVHPTPGIDGPGPQRIILGQNGEVWYTADHYKTFRRIKTED